MAADDVEEVRRMEELLNQVMELMSNSANDSSRARVRALLQEAQELRPALEDRAMELIEQEGGQAGFNRITHQCDRLASFDDRYESWATSAPSPAPAIGASEASLSRGLASPAGSLSAGQVAGALSGCSSSSGKVSDAGTREKRKKDKKQSRKDTIAEVPDQFGAFGASDAFGGSAAPAWPAAGPWGGGAEGGWPAASEGGDAPAWGAPAAPDAWGASAHAADRGSASGGGADAFGGAADAFGGGADAFGGAAGSFGSGHHQRPAPSPVELVQELAATPAGASSSAHSVARSPPMVVRQPGPSQLATLHIRLPFSDVEHSQHEFEKMFVQSAANALGVAPSRIRVRAVRPGPL